MKKHVTAFLDKYRATILTTLILLIAFVSKGQVLQVYNQYGGQWKRIVVDSLFGVPKDTFAVPASLQNIPFIANKNGSIYNWNISTHVWNLFSSGITQSALDDTAQQIRDDFPIAQTYQVVLTGSNYTVADGVTHVQLNAGAAGVTITMPSAATWPGRMITIAGGLNNQTTVSPPFISNNGVGGTYAIVAAGASIDLISNGTNWIQVVRGTQMLPQSYSGATGVDIFDGFLNANTIGQFHSPVFRKIKAGTGVTVTNTGNAEVEISATGTSGISEIIAGYGQTQVNDSTVDNDSLVMANRDWVMDRIADSDTANIIVKRAGDGTGQQGWYKADTSLYIKDTKGSTHIGVTTGTDSSKVIALLSIPVSYVIAASDETTDITTGTAKVTFRMPYAMTVTGVRASVNTVSSSGLPTIDINEAGTTILSTKITIDASEKTSTTAATPPVISDTALADDAEITIDIDVAGTGAKGLKIIISGTRTL